MKKYVCSSLFLSLLFVAGSALAEAPKGKAAAAPTAAKPKVLLSTSQGDITIELESQVAPKTVENFLGYVKSGHYNGTIFHRVISDFMVQGGGFQPGMKEKSTGKPIQNEADNGLKNKRGTVAMARTNDPHSASAQFFINVVDNTFLDFRSKDVRGYGYAVFGQVIKGMDVVDKIRAVKTTTKGPFADVPAQDVVIKSAKVVE